AVIVLLWQGDRGVDSLLVLSQVALSLQLSFAVVPLITFTSDRRRMGEFVNPWWVQTLAIVVAVLITGLNAKLAFDVIGGWIQSSHGAWWAWGIVVPATTGLSLLLLYLVCAPFLPGAQHALPVEPGLAAAGSSAQRAPVAIEAEPLRWQSGNSRR